MRIFIYYFDRMEFSHFLNIPRRAQQPCAEEANSLFEAH